MAVSSAGEPMTLTYPAPNTRVFVEPAHATTRRIRPRALAAPDGPELDAALAAVAKRCACRPAVAAALWWKQYSWYVVAAAFEGWAAGELPELGAGAACVELADDRPYVTVCPERWRTRPADFGPAQFAGWLRAEIMTDHLAPILEQLHVRTRAGRRLLWGSVAHAIALPLSRRVAAPEVEVPRFLEWVGGPVTDLIEVAPAEDRADDRADDAAGEGVRVTRKTCCLAFRSECGGGAEPTVCGYCPVARARSDEMG